MPQNKNSVLAALGIICGVAMSTFFMWLYIQSPNKYQSAPPPQTDVIETPVDEDPPIQEDGTGGPEMLQKIDLLKERIYTPTKSPFTDKNSYDEEAIKIAITGEFKTVTLKIKGNILDSSRKFLILNFDRVSGIVRAVRKYLYRLDLEETEKRGGVFSAENPIDLEISLTEEIELATTNTGFKETGEGVKKYILWNEMIVIPPTVVPILIVPFSEDGSFGGASITNLEIDYICKDGTDCGIVKCAQGEKITACLEKNFGKEAMYSWCERSLVKDCPVRK